MDFEPLKVWKWNDYVIRIMRREVEEYKTDHPQLPLLKRQLEEHKHDPFVYEAYLTERLNRPQAIAALQEKYYEPLLFYLLHELARARRKVLELTTPPGVDILLRILA
jgi:hypothetical protein